MLFPVLSALAVALVGGWLVTLGGFILIPLGALVAAVGLGWLATEVAHLRMRGRADAPGVVEVVEGRVRYFAPDTLGGEVSLAEIVEVRALRLAGRGQWRLRTRDGQALLVPVDAAGAGALVDAFAVLPGADLGRIAAGLAKARSAGGPSVVSVWVRPGAPAASPGMQTPIPFAPPLPPP